jgi:hypothetical protein
MNVKTPAKHNHEWIWTEGYRAAGECPRCDFLRAAKAAEGETPHNHEKMPFGRRVAGCPRCIELANGAAPREGYSAHQRRLDAQRRESMRKHFMDPNSTCDHITCFDW